jgi:hypothetical protein
VGPRCVQLARSTASLLLLQLKLLVVRLLCQGWAIQRPIVLRMLVVFSLLGSEVVLYDEGALTFLDFKRTSPPLEMGVPGFGFTGPAPLMVAVERSAPCSFGVSTGSVCASYRSSAAVSSTAVACVHSCLE